MRRFLSLAVLCGSLLIVAEAASGKAACDFYGLQTTAGQALLKRKGWRCTPTATGWKESDPCSWGSSSGIGCDGGITLSDIIIDCAKWGGKLGGNLGPSLSDYTSLRTLTIKNCGLTGGLPARFTQKNVLMSLASLDLSGNSLSGSLPQTLGQGGSMDSLASMDLSNNAFTGSLPALWASRGYFVNLGLLNLRNNRGLIGGVPPAWGQASAGWPASCAVNIAGTSIKGPLNSSMNSGNFKLYATVGAGKMCGPLPKPWRDSGTDGGVYPAWLWPNAPLSKKYRSLPAC